MSEPADYSEKSTKTCFIVLEKLDEKLINHYLEKRGSTKTVKNIGSIKNLKRQPLKKNIINCSGCLKTKKNLKEKRRHKDAVTKNELMQKKRKIRTFNYVDDVSNKSISKKKKSASENDKTKKLRAASDSVDKSKESCSELKKTHDNANGVTMKYKKSSSSEVEKSHTVFLKNIFENPNPFRTGNHGVAISTADNEIEVVEKYSDLSSTFQNINCNKTEESHNREKLLVNTGSVEEKIFEEDEYDLREDSEDDKKTVIFEKDFQKERDLDIIDTDEQKIESAERKLKKREITNQKIQKLIHLKPKNMGGNLGAERNLEANVRELFIEQEATEVSPLPEDVSENCLKEVCSMVQRLYELYKIILHLQAELQNNQLSFNFSRAITDQQKQFQREIRKNQKTIIKCYEKLLLFYKNADKVALIISKRTSISALEVIEVISQCLLVEGACELKESKNKSNQNVEKEEAIQPSKVSYDSDSLSKIITDNSERLRYPKMVQKTNCLGPPSHFYFPSGKNPDLRQRVTNESISILTTPIKENSKICFQNLPNRAIRISPPEHQTQRIENEKQKKLIQKIHFQKVVQNSRVGHTQQTQRLTVLPRNGHPINGLTFPNRNIILSDPKSDCSAIASQSQRSNLLSVPSIQIGSTELPFPVQFLNWNSKNSSINHAGRSSSDVLNPESGVSIPMVAENIAQHQSSLLNNAFSVETYNEMVNAQRQVQTPSNEIRCPLMNSVRFPNQKFGNLLSNGVISGEIVRSRFRTEPDTRTGLENVPSRVRENSQVLDPTIPKRLTMKNWKLQAGPVLDLETKEKNVKEPKEKQNPCQSFKEKRLDYHEQGNPDLEDSKTREYVCAQNECKKPGVLICKGCQSIIYCSEICQLKNWTEKHMIECHQLKKLRE